MMSGSRDDLTEFEHLDSLRLVLAGAYGSEKTPMTGRWSEMFRVPSCKT